MGKSLRVLVVDDHSMVRNGTRLVLESLADDVQVLEAKNGSNAKKLLSSHDDLDLVLLDIGLPDITGLELLEEIRLDHPLLPVLMISASDNSAEVAHALKSGARGFIHKSEDEDIMQNAINLVLSGGIYFPPSLLSKGDTQPQNSGSGDLKQSMTPRQLQVVKLITEGKQNKAIALELGCTEATIRVHVTAIFKAMNVSNRTEAAVMAQSIGLVD